MDNSCESARNRLVELGGGMTQDLGLGRMVGQVGMFLYLSEGESSLDDVSSELGLSKASVSIAARQLESFGLLQTVWKRGDRKNYYRLVSHIGLALQDQLMSIMKGKVKALSMELGNVEALLEAGKVHKCDSEAKYMRKRVGRAKKVCNMVEGFLGNPILNLLKRRVIRS